MSELPTLPEPTVWKRGRGKRVVYVEDLKDYARSYALAARAPLEAENARLRDAMVLIRNHTSVNSHQIEVIDAALEKGLD